MKVIETIVVTRHPALVEYLREKGLIEGDIPVLAHATVEDVKNKRVIGVLPLSLAAEAFEVVEIPLNLPQQMRGRELSIEEVRQYAGEPAHYMVVRNQQNN